LISIFDAGVHVGLCRSGAVDAGMDAVRMIFRLSLAETGSALGPAAEAGADTPTEPVRLWSAVPNPGGAQTGTRSVLVSLSTRRALDAYLKAIAHSRGGGTAP
jgi:hypothetical protein